MTKAPCFTCNKHDEDCHAKCPAYKKYEKVHEEERKAINKARHEYNLGFGARWRTDKEFRNENTERRRRQAKVFKQTMR